MKVVVAICLGLLIFTGCSMSWKFWEKQDRSEPVPVRLDGGGRVARAGGPNIAMTKEHEELRRLRQQHKELIESIPAEATVEPTMTLTERQKMAGITVLEHPDGVAVGGPVNEDWFDSGTGLEFYREEGGDWTGRRVRQNHSHRRLFYYTGYPEGVKNFQDGSIARVIGRELAFEAVQMLPLLGEVTPGMVDRLSYGLGWELVDSPGAVVNVWSELEIDLGKEVHRYVVGGVMEMDVGVIVDDGERLEFVEFGRWVGPVVVERLAFR